MLNDRWSLLRTTSTFTFWFGRARIRLRICSQSVTFTPSMATTVSPLRICAALAGPSGKSSIVVVKTWSPPQKNAMKNSTDANR